jgi:hypothetical protein
MSCVGVLIGHISLLHEQNRSSLSETRVGVSHSEIPRNALMMSSGRDISCNVACTLTLSKNTYVSFATHHLPLDVDDAFLEHFDRFFKSHARRKLACQFGMDFLKTQRHLIVQGFKRLCSLRRLEFVGRA